MLGSLRVNEGDNCEPGLTYELRAGLYRAVCENGLMVRMGDFGLIRVHTAAAMSSRMW